MAEREEELQRLTEQHMDDQMASAKYERHRITSHFYFFPRIMERYLDTLRNLEVDHFFQRSKWGRELQEKNPN